MATNPVRKIIVNRKRYMDMLTQDESAILFWKRVSFKDFAAASTTTNLDLTGFPGSLLVEGGFISVVQLFSGGGAGSATLSVGTTVSATAFVTASNVFTGATNKIYVGAAIAPGTMLTAATDATGPGTLRIQLASNVNTNLLTFGKADIYVRFRAASIRTS
jgi:hypothetical protein